MDGCGGMGLFTGSPWQLVTFASWLRFARACSSGTPTTYTVFPCEMVSAFARALASLSGCTRVSGLVCVRLGSCVGLALVPVRTPGAACA